MEYPNNMDDIQKKTEEHNSNKKQKILIIFDDMIADMLINKTLIQYQLNYLLEVEN